MRYSVEDLSHLEAPRDTVSQRLAVDGVLPSMEKVRTLASWDEDLLGKFDRTTADLTTTGVDRSGAMAELSYLMAEHGWSDEQIYVGLTDVDDRWGKFVGRYNRHSLLVDLVNRARQKVGYASFGRIDAAAIVAGIQGGGREPTKTGFSWTDFLQQDFTVNWQLEGLMPANGLGLVVAPPGTGKSQLLLNMGADLAIGRPRYLHWQNLGGPQRVLWLSLEMNAEGVFIFMSTMDRAYPEARDRALLGANFHVEALGTPMPLDQQAGQEWFEAKLEEYQPDVVMIDSLQMVVSKELTDETGVKDLMHYLAGARKKHRCSMVIVHHHRKKSTEASKKHVLELDDVYGSRYITAAVDFVLGLTKQTDDVLQVKTMKNRYARMDHDFNIIRDGNLTFDVEHAGAMAMAAASGLMGTL